MTNEELEKRTKQWSQQYFHRPFSHQIFFNRRLKTTGGRYHLADHHIDINPLMLSQFDEENLKKWFCTSCAITIYTSWGLITIIEVPLSNSCCNKSVGYDMHHQWQQYNDM
jgi:Uncharacterized protein conserved in bacteria